MYTQVAQEDMYELCSNVSAGSWPAVLDDELVRIVGEGVRYKSQLPFQIAYQRSTSDHCLRATMMPFDAICVHEV